MFTRRRDFLGFTGMAAALAAGACSRAPGKRPNILFAISDDQTWLHAGAYGDPVVKTPAFDRVAQSGVRFTQAICSSPGCAPSRAAILTGRHPWQLEEAGTHASIFSRKHVVYPDLLAEAGYHVGLTGKGAGPANFEAGGWDRNPAGPAYQQRKAETPPGINNNDYAANFGDFLAKRPEGQPFAFWYGCHEPHRAYHPGIGLKSGKRLEDVIVPPFYPDTEEIRSDILDYYVEIEHFDAHLGRILNQIEQAGELDNTLIVATSDNGMPFPRAKATMFEYGIHLPLAIACPGRFRGGRVVEDLVSFTDYAPTILEAAGLTPPANMVGRSLISVLESNRQGRVEPARNHALSGRERHSHSRFDNLGYPARALRNHEYLYIRNFAPDRWPAGDPPEYHDIDAAPAKTLLMDLEKKDPSDRWAQMTFAKQPPELLYDIRNDPGCLTNLAESAEHAAVKKQLSAQLEAELTAHGDPRMLGKGDIWESYPRHSPMRPQLGGFAERGEYNPKYQ
ncbi:MAG: sulfatase [Bryobacteraceae bacterium]|nr:sulfatase [Bryobacteraceae bacterium]